jgi:hypothetical protein
MTWSCDVLCCSIEDSRRRGGVTFRQSNNRALVRSIISRKSEPAPALDTPGTHAQGRRILCDRYEVEMFLGNVKFSCQLFPTAFYFRGVYFILVFITLPLILFYGAFKVNSERNACVLLVCNCLKIRFVSSELVMYNANKRREYEVQTSRGIPSAEG